MIMTPAQIGQLLMQAAAGDQEACGVLIGRREPHIRVEAVLAGQNLHPTPARHFLLDAATLLRADRAARATGREIIGFYHSHPRGTALPSLADRRAAWPGYVQVIIGTTRQGRRYLCAWLIAADGTLRAQAIVPSSDNQPVPG